MSFGKLHDIGKHFANWHLVQLFGVAGTIAISLAVNNGLGMRLANLDRTQISALEKVQQAILVTVRALS
jgi:Na+-translocating ferredoxin:NAD+ oxidoreductase RnfE subunit